MQRDLSFLDQKGYFHDLTKMMSPEAQILPLNLQQFQCRLELRLRPRYEIHDDPKGPFNRLVMVPCYRPRHWPMFAVGIWTYFSSWFPST